MGQSILNCREPRGHRPCRVPRARPGVRVLDHNEASQRLSADFLDLRNTEIARTLFSVDKGGFWVLALVNGFARACHQAARTRRAAIATPMALRNNRQTDPA